MNKPDPIQAPKVSTKQKELFRAVQKGDVGGTREIAKTGINVNFLLPDQKGAIPSSPLMRACFDGHAEIASILLKHHAMVDLTSETGRTALFCAVVSEKKKTIFKIASLLIKHGAKPDCPVLNDANGRLFVASIRKDALPTVRLLLDAGAELRSDLDIQTTPLIEAATHSDLEIVAELLKRGANAKHMTPSGWCAVTEAARNGDPDIVALLLKHDADPNVPTDEGNTALTEAALGLGNCCDNKDGKKYLEVVRLLVEAGADVNARAYNGWTPLDFAEYNPYIGDSYYESRWFGKGGDYLRSVGAKRSNQL